MRLILGRSHERSPSFQVTLPYLKQYYIDNYIHTCTIIAITTTNRYTACFLSLITIKRTVPDRKQYNSVIVHENTLYALLLEFFHFHYSNMNEIALNLFTL